MMVSGRTIYFLIAVGIFLASLAVIVGYYYRRSRRSSQGSWEDLLNRLASVDQHSIQEIALDIVDESGQPRRDENSAVLEPSDLWTRIGGLKGLEVLESNGAVLIDLAFYVQQRYPEALAVTEELRLAAREIAWHVERLRGAAQTGKLESSFPMYAQRAVATYYLMTRRVLDLYEQQRLPMLADLQKAL
jgi:hypothetical protein